MTSKEGKQASINEIDKSIKEISSKTDPSLRLPVLPIRDVVLFPYMILPLAVGREKSVKALEAGTEKHLRRVLFVTQKSPNTEDPKPEELYTIGTIGEIIQVFKLPDGSVKTFVQGLKRGKFNNHKQQPEGYLEADVEQLETTPAGANLESQALVRQVKSAFKEYMSLKEQVPADVIKSIDELTDADKLSDILSANIALKTQEKQGLLELTSVKARMEKLLSALLRELEILNLERKIQTRVKSQIEKSQKEYFLHEQMKAIQKELKQRDDWTRELDEMEIKIKKAKMNDTAQEAGLNELNKLRKMMPHSPEASVLRSYLDWLTALPWTIRTKDKLNIEGAKKILEEDHYSLDKAKERILEYIAVCSLKKKLKGPILCFVGPPGVGKTSLAKSVARALNRNFVRISLGGVRDEAEIRGHRRTYIGSLPGKIIQQMRRAKSRNPLFLLDEIDKMGTDWRGDPASALLEVLDPEQNTNFVDHYLDVPFDLSDVFFITTANTTYSIPPSLEDRLEVIRFPGYTMTEKMEIAKRYLVPKQSKEHGLEKRGKLIFEDAAIAYMIESYTREAGVRNLDREIANVSRKAARKLVESKEKNQKITVKSDAHIERYLGIPKFKKGKKAVNGIGVATGLAWTEHGGELLTMEVSRVPGKGNLIMTGKLGEVMQESAQAAYTYVKSVSDKLAYEIGFIKNYDLHLHVPEGAVPKDGPSAGVAIATTLSSFLTNKPVRKSVAMTGEITLRGAILPVGGIKEKLIAAHREGVKSVYIPKDNEKDLEDVPADVKKDVKITCVENMDELLAQVLST
ncbi:endopeptidase La [Elusimicrobiota bacterium]